MLHTRTLVALGFSIPLVFAIALSAMPDPQGWRPLFDGKTLDGWRGYKQQPAPAGWKVQDGMLVRLGEGGDLVTADEFGDFELALEWKISEGGNSGIFYRALESTDLISAQRAGIPGARQRATR